MVWAPRDMEDELQLADWLELAALGADDGDASAMELVGMLQMEGQDEDDAMGRSRDATAEIETRVRSAGEAYPFAIALPGVVSLRGNWQDHVPYVFCLCLSCFGWQQAPNAPINPRQLFEELSCTAAEQYLQGTSMPFGEACRRGVVPFETAVNTLCQRLGEGRGFKRRTKKSVKDDKLDVVAWKPFPDKRPTQLIMFGQCASGWNWEDKLKEMIPNAFCKLWMQDSVFSPILRSFFIPQRIENDDWIYHAARGEGILFDRCRIAFWAQQARRDSSQYADWCRTAFPILQKN